MSATAGPLEFLVAAVTVAVAVVTLTRRTRLTAAISFLVLGLGLALTHALLGAPDVALAEAAIGSGVTGALFLYAVTRVDALAPARSGSGAADPGRRGRWNVARVLFALAVTALLTAGLVRALLGVAAGPAVPTGPDGGAEVPPAVGPLVAEHLGESGVEHPVTAVLLNFRALDTFLEIVVLLASVVVVLNLADRDGPPPTGADHPAILTTYVRLVAPVLVLLAAWMLFAGSSSPGGAFQGGAVVAAVLILLALAGYRVADLGGPVVRWVAVAAVLVFLAVAVIGPLLGGAWLELDVAWAGPVIIALETVLAAVIGASLAVSFLALRTEEDA